MSTTSESTTHPAPDKKPGLADRVDSAVDQAQTKVDAVIDAAQERAHTTGDDLAQQATDARLRAIELAVTALEAAQTAVEQAVRKAKDALQS